ncbi:hypothetical protein IH799_05545, partial [candidate division KSB1 bacterium]|nr:hypothetical protein [candidate division KSB1 bacterium]
MAAQPHWSAGYGPAWGSTSSYRSKHRLFDESKETETKFKNYEDAVHQQELQIDHFKKQVDALTIQLQEAELDKKETERKFAFESKNVDDRIARAKEHLKQELSDW